MNKEQEILEQDIIRKKIFKEYGYDMDKERDFVVDSSKPISGKILEAGTGKGHFTIALAKKGYELISFDISKEAQAEAKKNIHDLGLSKFVNFKIEDGEKLSFKNKSFDTIFSVNTLHHINQPFVFIDELIRVWSNKGKIIITDFTNIGFDMLDKIHAAENDTHDRGKTNLTEIQNYLNTKNFQTKIIKTKFQEILIIKNKTK
jgi:ubiquinone/menaquinone biosynthesis C-methylase UbiE